MLKAITSNGAMLGVFAIVTTAVIAITFDATAPRIAEQKQRKLLSLLGEVVPSEKHDNELSANCIISTDERLGIGKAHKIYRALRGNQPAALALEVTANDGYSGDIDFVLGVTTDLEVTGLRVVDHKETPGLGDKIDLSVSDWALSFAGKQYSSEQASVFQVKKDGGEFDQFTGATITPRAVVNAAAKALQYVASSQAMLFSLPNSCGSASDSSSTTSTAAVSAESGGQQ